MAVSMTPNTPLGMESEAGSSSKGPVLRLTVRAHMHPGYQNPDFVGPAGPVDTGLTVLAFQTPTGRPIALLANYSMHYVGVGRDVVSPDYYGPFCENMERLVGAERGGQPFVAIMSQGTSGDQHWMDYGQPKKEMNFRMYADALAQKAYTAYQKIEYRNWVPIGMAEKKLKCSPGCCVERLGAKGVPPMEAAQESAENLSARDLYRENRARIKCSVRVRRSRHGRSRRWPSRVEDKVRAFLGTLRWTWRRPEGYIPTNSTSGGYTIGCTHGRVGDNRRTEDCRDRTGSAGRGLRQKLPSACG